MNPEHDTDTTEAEDCTPCKGTGKLNYTCCGVLVHNDVDICKVCGEKFKIELIDCEPCKGEGFVYEDNRDDNYYDMRENEKTGN